MDYHVCIMLQNVREIRMYADWHCPERQKKRRAALRHRTGTKKDISNTAKISIILPTLFST